MRKTPDFPQELTINRFAEMTGTDRRTVKRRLDREGIKPSRVSGAVKYYPIHVLSAQVDYEHTLPKPRKHDALRWLHEATAAHSFEYLSKALVQSFEGSPMTPEQVALLALRIWWYQCEALAHYRRADLFNEWLRSQGLPTIKSQPTEQASKVLIPDEIRTLAGVLGKTLPDVIIFDEET